MNIIAKNKKSLTITNPHNQEQMVFEKAGTKYELISTTYSFNDDSAWYAKFSETEAIAFANKHI